MKISRFYIGMIFSLLSLSFFTSGCSDEYEYSTDYSAYDGVTLKINLVDENDVLKLNLANKTFNLTVNVTPEDIIIDSKGYIYEIEDETVATISQDGVITMLKEGETKLTVKFRGNQNVSTSCTVKVVPTLASDISVPESITVEEFKTIDLSKKITVVPSDASNKLSYKSEDVAIATVNEEGIVTGVAQGNTTITVATTDGTNISKEIPVEVVGKIYITDVSLPEDRITGKEFVMGQVLNIGQYTEITPANASEPIIKFYVKDGSESIITASEDGVVTCTGTGTGILVVETQDNNPDGNIRKEIEISVVASGWYERSFWFVDTSYRFDSPMDELGEINYIPDNGKGMPEQLIDGRSDTYLTYLKPGRGAYNGYEQHNTEHYLTIDMGGETEFNCFKWMHRNTANKNWQVWQISMFGSNDGETYNVIQENIDLDRNTLEKSYDIPTSKYRYIKVQFNDWDKASGYNMTIAEFNVSKK